MELSAASLVGSLTTEECYTLLYAIESKLDGVLCIITPEDVAKQLNIHLSDNGDEISDDSKKTIVNKIVEGIVWTNSIRDSYEEAVWGTISTAIVDAVTELIES